MCLENNVLPLNIPRRQDITLRFHPRNIYPVHHHNIKNGKINAIDLVILPMHVVRKWTNIKCLETPEARRNLQTWVDNLGPALYNPVEWRWRPKNLKRPVMWRGAHRLRALEALDFDFIFVYQIIGDRIPHLPKVESDKMKKNRMLPTQKISSRDIPCKKCGWVNRWKTKKPKTLNLRYYKCNSCNHYFETEVIYPEPV